MALTTGLVTRILDLLRSKAGALSPSGIVTRFLITSRATIESALTFSGSILYSMGQSILRGTLTLTGLVSRSSGSFGRLKTGVLSLTPGLLYYIKRLSTFAGDLTFGGRLSHAGEYLRSSFASLSPSGILTRTNSQLARLREGTLTFAGSVYRATLQTYDGAIGLAGSVAYEISTKARGAVGTLTSAGSFLRQIVGARTRAGILSLVGQVEGVKTTVIDFFYRGYAGALILTGSLSGVKNAADKTLSGALDLLGRITTMDIRLARLSGASITPSGIVTWIAVMSGSAYRGTITLAGALSRKRNAKRSKAGTVTFAGSATPGLSGIWNYYMTGACDFVGEITRSIEIAIVSTIGGFTLQGAISKVKNMARLKAGTLAFIGSVAGLFTSRDVIPGYLTFSGALTRAISTLTRKTLTSSLGLSGAVSVGHIFARAAAGSLSFAGEQEAYKDALHYGPEVY